MIIAIMLAGLMAISCYVYGTDSWSQDFIDSFVAHYEFNPEGRYTHEYHPFLLEWTSKSLDQLEQRLASENLSLKGRLVIMGYEEQAVPQYYSNFRKSKINDEASRKNQAGWSLRLHNRFGFMTGFLFKDLSYYQTANPGMFTDAYEHINSTMIPIFDDRAFIFHEHAFGQALPLIRKEQEVIMKKLISDDSKSILAELQRFWKTLYSGGFKVGNMQIAGTQDVLFSVAYANHLTKSPLPLMKFFIGPDITYPIEVTAKQDSAATVHAQTFIKTFMQKLKPINGQRTVFVFCSFVDGVGKSTMLGNIKNYMNFGTNVTQFEHVDNSSSQLCSLFKYEDKVFIADLPAQVSHFTYKPDGYVFVDVQTNYSKEFIAQLDQFVSEHKDELEQKRKQLFDEVNLIINQYGRNAPQLNDHNNPWYAFIKNVIILSKDRDVWLPFEYEGQHYIFKDGKPTEIRYLTSLSAVKSEGLKNIESEQMLFFDGIRLPYPYETFLDDFVLQLKAQEIENVVFVDFLSMYPRSSRENVRVNYLLQQMALLNTSFNPANSLYKDFVSGGELLQTISQPGSVKKIKSACELEVLLRLALFKLLITRTQGDLTGVDLPSLTNILEKEYDEIASLWSNYTESMVAKKMLLEIARLEKMYGYSKSFLAIQQLSLKKVQALSDVLQHLFTECFDHELITELWRNPGNLENLPTTKTEGEWLKLVVKSDHGQDLRIHSVLHAHCKNEVLLDSFLRSLRANWYASLFNLLGTEMSGDGMFSVINDYHRVVPLMLMKGNENLLYSIQYRFPTLTKKVELKMRAPYRAFNLSNQGQSAYMVVNDVVHRYDWGARATNHGLYAFDCSMEKEDSKQQRYVETSISGEIVQQYQKKHGATMAMTTTKLLRALLNSSDWEKKRSSQQSSARRNGLYQKPNPKPGEQAESPLARRSYKIFTGLPEQKPILQFLARCIATLEMVIKDPDLDVVVRSGNRDDFKAALKLFEYLVLPNYCHVLYFEDLFDDYDSVEPYPSWNFWDSIQG